MSNEKTIQALMLILENINFENVEIASRQIACCRDLIDTVIIDLTKDMKCDHPEEARRNLTTMGDIEKTEQCSICGEMIISQFKE